MLFTTLTRPLSFALPLSLICTYVCCACALSFCGDHYMVPSSEKVMHSADSNVTVARVCLETRYRRSKADCCDVTSE